MLQSAPNMSTVFLVARFEIGHTRQKFPACGGNLLLHRISCAVTLNYNNTAPGQKQVFFLQNLAILKKILPQFCHPSCRVFPSGFWRGNLPFQGLFAVIWGGFSFLLRKYPLSYKFLRFALVGTRIGFAANAQDLRQNGVYLRSSSIGKNCSLSSSVIAE